VILSRARPAGKGAFKRITQRLTALARVARCRRRTTAAHAVYFQRYVSPAGGGEIVLFTGAGTTAPVERVMGFCDDAQYEESSHVPSSRCGAFGSSHQYCSRSRRRSSTCASRPLHDPLKQWS